jgi:hypothetical protein
VSNVISLSITAQDFHLKKEESGGQYTLHFHGIEDGQCEVSITIGGAALEALIRQAGALLPSPSQELTLPDIEANWRATAWPIRQLSDKSWQVVLREVSSESLCLVLWYLKDVELARRVMNNFSLRAAEMLIEDLIAKFQGRDPDNLPKEAKLVRQARKALQEMLDLLNRMVAIGQIEEYTA